MGVSVSVWVSGLLSICAYVSVSYACAHVSVWGGGCRLQQMCVGVSVSVWVIVHVCMCQCACACAYARVGEEVGVRVRTLHVCSA